MKLALSVIAYHLRQQHSLSETYASSERRLVRHIRFFITDESAEEVLYLIDWEKLSVLENPPDAIVCLGGGAIAQSYVRQKKIDSIILPEDADAVLVYQQLSDIFYFLNSYEMEIKDAIIAEKDLDYIVNIVSRLFDNPVFITDTALRVLSYSKNEKNEMADTYLTDTLSEGVSSQRVMDVMKDTGLISTLDRSKQALYIDQPPIAPFFCANFMENGKRIASITVAGYTSTLDEGMLPLLDSIVELITNVVQKIGNAYYLRSSNLEKMVLDMLSGAMLDRRVLQYNISEKQWRLEDEYQLLKIEMDKKDVVGGAAQYTQELARELFRDAILIGLQDAFIIVIHRTGHNDTDGIIENQFHEYLQNRKCRAGASMRFHDFSLLHDAYILSGIALEKGDAVNPGKLFYCYEDYITAHIIDLCAQSIDVSSLCHPEVVRLFRYDSKHGSALLESLYAYITEERSLAAASEKLKIHRNTLVYRISKITDMCDLDIKDSAVRMHIIWSYQVLRHIHPEQH